MDWTVTGLNVAPNFQGIEQLVQLIAPYTLTLSPPMVTSTYGNYILDDPLAPNAGLSPISIQGTVGFAKNGRPNVSKPNFLFDSPFENLPVVGKSVAFARDTFETFLMYMPTGPQGNWTKSINVSLEEMDWFWKGAANRGLGGVGLWGLETGSGQFTQNPTARPSWTLPVWSNYASNFTKKSTALAATIIQGTVSGANGNPIPNATVTLTWTDPNVPNQQDKVLIITDANGQYAYAAAYGNATVTVTVNVTGQSSTSQTSTPNARSNDTPLNFAL